MNPIFSIIIPAYNIGKYIETAIDSCLDQINVQSFEYEIIVINDGSKDDTNEHLSKYKSYSNITIIEQDNKGLSATRNHGVDVAKGEYILFLDGDDWFAKNAFATLKQYVNKADLIMFAMVYYYSDSNYFNNSPGLSDAHIYTPEDLLKNTIGKSQFHTCPAPTKCYKRTIFTQKNQRFIEGILHEDGPFFIETLINVESIMYIEKFLYFYRQTRPGSITTDKHTWKNVYGIIKGNEHVFNIYGHKNKDVNYYYLATLEMQLFQKYKTDDDVKQLVGYFSKSSTRIFLFKSLLYFRFQFRTLLLGLLIICSPSLSIRLHSALHK